jgi:hypothetical protein
LWFVITAAQPSVAAARSQPSHKVSSSRPRGTCGAVSSAPWSASGRKEVKSGSVCAPSHSRITSSPTVRPVESSCPGVGLISMSSAWPLRLTKAAIASKLGIGSPA